MRRMIFPLAIAAAIVPAAVSSQTSGSASAASTTQASTGAQSAVSAAADAAAEARIDVAIERATNAGIPAQMLENKVAEGRAKGIPMTRIAAAVEHRAEVLARIQTVLASRPGAEANTVGTAELIAAADAHEAGISLENISTLSTRAGNDRAVALTVLADLVASGRAPDHALLRVQNAMQAGGNALGQLRQSVVRANSHAKIRIGG